MEHIGKHPYITYSIYEFKDNKLLNADKKFKGFPKFVWYTPKANDKDTKKLKKKERSSHIAKKNSSIQYQKIVNEPKVSVVQASTDIKVTPKPSIKFDKGSVPPAEPAGKPAPSAPVTEKRLLLKVGIVDVQRVLEDSKKGKEARQYYEGLVSLRTEQELINAEQELIRQILNDIAVIVEEFAEKEGFNLILDAFESGVVYADEKFYITDNIIEIYDKKVSPPKTEGN